MTHLMPRVKFVEDGASLAPFDAHVLVEPMTAETYKPSGAVVEDERIEFLVGPALPYEEALRQAMRWALRFKIAEIHVVNKSGGNAIASSEPST